MSRKGDCYDNSPMESFFASLETALVTWERDVLGPAHPVLAKSYERSHRRAYKFPNGSCLVTGGMDEPQRSSRPTTT